MARIVLEDLSKGFVGPGRERVAAVRNVNLVVEDREFLVLVGPSGCGKSTVLRLIAGLEEISEGRISIDGRTVNEVSPKDRDIAMVFQNYALYPHMTVFENMAFALSLRKVPKAEIQERVGRVAEMLGLTPLLRRHPKALSGGQRQRVAVGRAIVREPRAFLFDEPLSNLDAQMRVQMRMELARLHQRLQSTMIYVTHDQVEAMTLGDRIAVMNEGRIQQVAAPDELYQRPANRFVAGFIGAPPMNFFRGRLERADGAAWFVSTSAPADGEGQTGLKARLPEAAARALGEARGETLLGARPEDVQIRAAADPHADGHGTASVQWVESLGAERHVYLSAGGETFIARTDFEMPFHKGDAVSVRLDPRKLHFFDATTGDRIEGAGGAP